VLVDTSASRAVGFSDQASLVGAVTRALASRAGKAVPVEIAAFDQSVESLYQGDAASVVPDLPRRIEARGALGASNLEAALAWAAGRAKQSHVGRVVLVTDGVPTAGATDADALAKRAGELAVAGVQRIDAVVVGGARDDALLRRVCVAGLPHAGAVIDARMDAAEIAQAKRDLPEAVFQELYEAEASDDEGNPFGIEHIAHRLF
jgi:hypothetical protein